MQKLLVLFVVFLTWSMLGCDLLTGPTDDTNTFADVNAMWFTGTTGPATSQGVDGDLYMNTANGEIFVKMSGAWVASGNVTGPTGPAGPTGADTIDQFSYLVVEDDIIPFAASDFAILDPWFEAGVRIDGYAYFSVTHPTMPQEQVSLDSYYFYSVYSAGRVVVTTPTGIMSNMNAAGTIFYFYKYLPTP